VEAIHSSPNESYIIFTPEGVTKGLALEGTSCSWTGGTQLYPQLSELPSWIVPTRTTTELVRLCYTHLSIRTPLQGIAYIILSNEKHSVTVLCAGN